MYRVLYPLIFTRHYRTWMAEESLDADRMRKLQMRKLDAILKAASTTAYYKDILPANIDGESFLADPQCIPMTKKPAIRDNPESFLSGGRDQKSLGFAQTSGSTGVPTRIYLDSDIAYYRRAVRYATDVLFGRMPFERFARLHTYDYDRSSLMYTGLFPKLFLSISDRPEENFQRLLRYRPEMARSYPSSLHIIARLNDIAGRPLSFKRAVCVSELLTDDMRRALEESFSCPVYNHYGSIELSSVARECVENRKLHVESHACHVEIVDDSGRPKKSGEGDIVVTPLFNRVMPILRFRVGDRASWGRECGCGRQTPVLGSLAGRTDDYIVLPSGRVVPGKNFYLEMSLLSHFYEYQIVQEDAGRMVFRFVPVGRLPPGVEEAIRGHILGQCPGEGMAVEFEQVERIRRGRTGKLRVVSSKVRLKP
jgi:phenylacetate-CoA ligase